MRPERAGYLVTNPAEGHERTPQGIAHQATRDPSIRLCLTRAVVKWRLAIANERSVYEV